MSTEASNTPKKRKPRPRWRLFLLNGAQVEVCESFKNRIKDDIQGDRTPSDGGAE